MFVLGLQGSPRKKGNTTVLLSAFIEEMKTRGVQTQVINVCDKFIKPCIGCANCERKGVCAIEDDDMTGEIYGLLRRADVVVLATPIYFYNATAQMKLLIDRSQALWARKYKLMLTDPGRPERKGILLAVGATKGRNLFEGMILTAKYFFDAIGAEFSGKLTYSRIEDFGDMEKHETVRQDIKTEVDRLSSLFQRKKILFACRENAGRSQMAQAFVRYHAGGRIDAQSAGSQPAEKINPIMEEAMQESGIDVAFQKPRSIDDAIAEFKPDMMVTMGCGEECPFVPGVKYENWDLPDPSGKPIEFVRTVRDDIEQKVKHLIDRL
ncbi:MAG: flavin reductase [Desulfobacterales bacterium CG23_combo_of_CG06-09_8_20_14_all_51_8]|nr:MAG: flavin reductase [Desulfobacterales bacterium CG23_combo_of_CG06-09_8_20_14_all_51_8]